MEDGLAGIDWSAPWFAPWRETGPRVACALGANRVADALNAAGPAPVRFVPQQELPPGEAYEAFVARTGLCPTRDNLHDLFNGLCWLAFPGIKAALNRIQAAELAMRGTAGPRGPVRDAVTVFDENGAVLDAPPPLWDALLARDWHRAFVALRPLWRDARVLVCGHALLEKLVRPRKNLTAHVWRAPLTFTGAAQADARLAARLDAAVLATKPFTPLPVLGIPGWTAANAEPSFYDDARVFRPAPARP